MNFLSVKLNDNGFKKTSILKMSLSISVLMFFSITNAIAIPITINTPSFFSDSAIVETFDDTGWDAGIISGSLYHNGITYTSTRRNRLAFSSTRGDFAGGEGWGIGLAYDSSDELEIVFDTAVSMVGFNIGTYSVNSNDWSSYIRFYDEDDNWVNGFSLSGQSNFFREDKFFIGTTIDEGSTSYIKRIRIIEGLQDGDFISIDNLTYDGLAVPLPASVWLFGSGLFVLAGLVRRKAIIN